MEEKNRYEKILEKIIEENEYCNMLGIEVIEVKEGYSKGRMKFDKKLCNPYGYIHGGCLYSFADVISGIASCSYGNYVCTISGNMNYLKPAINTNYLYCEAEVIKHGKSISYCNITITNDDGDIIDNGTFNLYVLPQKVE